MTECFVPIIDLLGCQSALPIPIELTPESQAALKATMDVRIWNQLAHLYIPVDNGARKRLKALILKRNPTR